MGTPRTARYQHEAERSCWWVWRDQRLHSSFTVSRKEGTYDKINTMV